MEGRAVLSLQTHSRILRGKIQEQRSRFLSALSFWGTLSSMSPTSAPMTARARARRRADRRDQAGRPVASSPNTAPTLSLRAVARELGMASSAVYRYFPSRDELLTALIVDAYDALGDTAEQALAGRCGGRRPTRWLALSTSIRAWAVAQPHEYALLYGSPVPGYRGAARHDRSGRARRVSRRSASCTRGWPRARSRSGARCPSRGPCATT